ncbi:MAG TPA: hypothetical protein VKR24_03135 [Candidatus Limnocylindrales bacterium]|nr:hypothetical protein [Candidatus Limnocylindrales bacterium]
MALIYARQPADSRPAGLGVRAELTERTQAALDQARRDLSRLDAGDPGRNALESELTELALLQNDLEQRLASPRVLEAIALLRSSNRPAARRLSL